MQKLLTFTAVLALLALPAYAQPYGKGPDVIVAKVKMDVFTDEVGALGTLKANESVVLASTVTERIVEVNFEDGQRVKKGELLVRMEADEEVAQLAEEKSRLTEAKKQVARLEPLAKKGAASKSSLDISLREAQSSQARIEAVESRISQKFITAPFDGVMGLRNISVGALVQPGTPLATVDDDSMMKLDFTVPSIYISNLGKGVKIEAVSRSFPNKKFLGYVAGVDSRIDTITRSIVVRALIDNSEGKLTPGLLMRVLLHSQPRQSLSVPEEAVIFDGRDKVVFVVNEKEGKFIAERRSIEIGERRPGEVEVTAGLAEGDSVVIHGLQKLHAGSEVKIRAESNGSETSGDLIHKMKSQPKE